MNWTEGRWLGARNEGFDVVHVLGTEGSRLVSRGLVDVQGGKPRRPWPRRRRRPSLVHLAHHRGPRWSGQHTALGVGFDLLRLVEADPDAGDHLRGKADKPDVVAVVGGSGLPPGGE